MTIRIGAGLRTEVHFYQWNETPEELFSESDPVTVTELEFFSAYDAETYLRNLSMDFDVLAYLRKQLFSEPLALSSNISNDELIAQFATLLAQGLYRAREFTAPQYAYVTYEPSRPGSPPVPERPSKPKSPPSPVENKAVLVEFIEVVERAGRTHVVVGAGRNSQYFQPAVVREDLFSTETDTDYCKQFINLLKDVDGPDQQHPEYHRPISVKARVMLNGQPKAGESVVFSFTLEKGKYRPQLGQFAREGFEKVGGPTTHIATTGSDGWTPNVMFMLSAYAGDIFTLFAKGPDGKELKIGSYQVWRRFWYQITHFKDLPPPSLTGAQEAYAAVFAEMLPTTIKELPLTEQTAPKGTFYPEWMVSGGNSTKQVPVVGKHNHKAFFSQYKPEKNKPVKGHLVLCNACWDPSTEPAAVESFEIYSNPSELLTLEMSGPQDGLFKPTLTGEPLLISGGWFQKHFFGPLTDENILIEPEGRTNLRQIRIMLPPEAPDPSIYEVTVALQLRSASVAGGYSVDANMVIARGGAQAKFFDKTVTHEFGHSFNQPPLPGAQNPNLPRHPLQYFPQDGAGPHCRTGANRVTPDESHPEKFIYENGTCIMFNDASSSNGLFCATCHPYIRLEGMKSLRARDHSE